MPEFPLKYQWSNELNSFIISPELIDQIIKNESRLVQHKHYVKTNKLIPISQHDRTSQQEQVWLIFNAIK